MRPRSRLAPDRPGRGTGASRAGGSADGSSENGSRENCARAYPPSSFGPGETERGSEAAVTYMPKGNAFVAGEHMSMPADWDRMENPVFELDPFGKLECDIGCGRGHVELIGAYREIARLRKRMHIDSMFLNFDLNRLRSDIGGGAGFDLHGAASSYSVPAGLAGGAPAELSEDYARALFCRREQLARGALEQLKYHYQKDAQSPTAKFRRATAPTDNGVQRISNPAPGDGSRNTGMLDEIAYCSHEFFDAFGYPLTRFACSLSTALKIARNSFEGCDPVVKAYKTDGILEFPGTSGYTMVVSNTCHNDVLYAISDRYALLKAEGPKIITQHRSGILDVLDFNQYRCAHQNLPTDRLLGCVIDLQTT